LLRNAQCQKTGNLKNLKSQQYQMLANRHGMKDSQTGLTVLKKQLGVI